MTSDREALREKVVKVLDETFRQARRRGMWDVSREHDCAEAAIAVVLEEAARVAEGKAQYYIDPETAEIHKSPITDIIAAAIRALKGKD